MDKARTSSNPECHIQRSESNLEYSQIIYWRAFVSNVFCRQKSSTRLLNSGTWQPSVLGTWNVKTDNTDPDWISCEHVTVFATVQLLPANLSDFYLRPTILNPYGNLNSLDCAIKEFNVLNDETISLATMSAIQTHQSVSGSMFARLRNQSAASSAITCYCPRPVTSPSALSRPADSALHSWWRNSKLGYFDIYPFA
jgi:hypothetical protein